VFLDILAQPHEPTSVRYNTFDCEHSCEVRGLVSIHFPQTKSVLGSTYLRRFHFPSFFTITGQKGIDFRISWTISVF